MWWLAPLSLFALTGCARHYSPECGAELYGFWLGLWHGFVCPYALVTNLFSASLEFRVGSLASF